MLSLSKHERKGLCPRSLGVPQTDTALCFIVCLHKMTLTIFLFYKCIACYIPCKVIYQVV